MQKIARQKARSKNRNIKNAPATIPDKSKAIKRPAAKHRTSGAVTVRVRSQRNSAVAKKSLTEVKPKTKSAPKRSRKKKNPAESEPSTPEVIEVKVESPSVFDEYDPGEFQKRFNQPTARVSTNKPTIHSGTVSSTVHAGSNLLGNNSETSTQRTESQAAANGDNFLQFVLSGTNANVNQTVDCGIQCAIRAQCDVGTNAVSPSGFDLLDVMFLHALADRLKLDQETVMKASEEVLAEIVKSFNLSEENGFDQVNASEQIFGSGDSLDFDYEYVYSGNGNSSPGTESVVSASPHNFDYGV